MWIAYLGLVSPLVTLPLQGILHLARRQGLNSPPMLSSAVMTLTILSLISVIPCFVCGTLFRIAAARNLSRHLREHRIAAYPPPVAGEMFGDWRVVDAQPDSMHMRRRTSAMVMIVALTLAATIYLSVMSQLFLLRMNWTAIPIGAIAVLIPSGVLLRFRHISIAWNVEPQESGSAILTITTLSGTLRRRSVTLDVTAGWTIKDRGLWIHSESQRFLIATVGVGTLGQVRARRIVDHLIRCGVRSRAPTHHMRRR